jgi:hypothetical protein
MHSALSGFVMPLVVAVASAAVALLVVEVVHRVLLRLGRRSPLLAELAERAHRPTQVGAMLVAVYYAVRDSTADARWRTAFLHVDQLLVIAAVAWLVGALVIVTEDAALARWRTDVPDNRQARRVHTQVVLIRRVTLAVIAILAAGVMLMTFPEVRILGTSVLASAGFAGIIAALAAQSLLRNVFAGLQLAFSDAVRLGDVVVVEQEWGRIEEITLSYVVVRVWDDRRLIMPTSYFTENTFQNWTRTEASLLGAVEFDVDWALPVDDMREELRAVLGGTDLWDERVCVLQVTDAVGSALRVRALVSAKDAPTLWDLRCFVRERLVGWVRDRHPEALTRLRAEIPAREATIMPPPVPARPVERRPIPDEGVVEERDGAAEPPGDSRVFGQSQDGRARNEAFTGPDQSQDRTPDQSQDQGPNQRPDQGPNQRPDKTPDEDPDQTPDHDPDRDRTA